MYTNHHFLMLCMKLKKDSQDVSTGISIFFKHIRCVPQFDIKVSEVNLQLQLGLNFPVYLCVYLFILKFTTFLFLLSSPAICCLSIVLSVFLSASLSIFYNVYPTVCSSILSTFSFCQSVYILSICLSVCLPCLPASLSSLYLSFFLPFFCFPKSIFYLTSSLTA